MKLIFFDIDGTLISNWKTLPDSAARAIQRARENGHLCLVNTGRTASLVMDWLPKLVTFDGYLCGCGTHVFFQGQELLHKTLTLEESIDVIRGLEEHKIDAILEGEGNNYHNDFDRMHTGTMRDYIRRHYAERQWESYREAPGNYDKFFCFSDDPGNVYRFMEQRGYLDLIDRENGYFEIVPKGYSKASCMDFLLKYLNDSGKYPKKITLEDTVAIGDSNNDLPMLTHAGTAIAMGESSANVLEIADYVTASVTDDGIWKALEWLGCI